MILALPIVSLVARAAAAAPGVAPLSVALAIALMIVIALGVTVALARLGLRAHEEQAQRERSLRVAADDARRQAELARARLATILDGLPDGVSAFDREWRWLYLNPATAASMRQLGKDPDRLIGKVMWDEIPALLGTSFEVALRRAAAERRFVEHRAYFAPLDRWVEQRLVPLPEGVVMYTRDVTERVRARETRARLAAIVESSDDAIVSMDLDGIIQSWNEGATRLFGWSPDEAIGRPISFTVPPGRESEEPEIMARVERGERIDHFETVRLRRDGSTLDVSLSISPIRTPAGVTVSAARIARDISQYRRAEDALRDEARLLTTLQSIGSTVTAELDLPRLAQLVTDEAAALTGAEVGAFFYREDVRNNEFRLFALSGIGGTTPANLVAPRDVPLLQSLAGGGAGERREDPRPAMRLAALAPAFPTDRLDETVRSWLAVPVVSRTGALLGMLAFAHGRPGAFTERHERVARGIASWAAVALDNARLYDAERAARAEAQVASRAKSDFLATMSHELRTPLNAIAGYTELLLLGVRGDLNADQREYLSRIQRAQHDLLSLINDVLNFTRIERGHLRLELREIPVAEVVGDLERLVAPQMHARGIRYDIVHGAGDACVRVDPEKARQVLLNLLTNGIKFTDPGGHIAVRTLAQDGVVAISVSDTGRGVPADKLELIFEPFVQLDRGLSSGHEGAGLGLSISRDLARAMGGDLTVVSAPDRGSTFTLTLPRVGG